MTIYKCTLNGLYLGTDTWTTSFFIDSTASLGTVSGTLNGAWSTAWVTATNGLENFSHSDVTLTGTTTYQLNSSLRTVNKQFTGLSLAGTDTSQSLPFQNAPVLNFFGANDTKSDRGFMFLPTTAQDTITGGRLTAGYQTSAKTVMDAFWVTMRGLSGYSNNKYNRHTNKQGDAPFTAHPITGYNLTNKMGTRRQRVRKLKATATVTGTV